MILHPPLTPPPWSQLPPSVNQQKDNNFPSKLLILTVCTANTQEHLVLLHRAHGTLSPFPTRPSSSLMLSASLPTTVSSSATLGIFFFSFSQMHQKMILRTAITAATFVWNVLLSKYSELHYPPELDGKSLAKDTMCPGPGDTRNQTGSVLKTLSLLPSFHRTRSCCVQN